MKPYVTTAKEFFAGFVEPRLKDVQGPFVALRGRYEFDVEGEGGGRWFVDFDRRSIGPQGEGAQCIVRAAERDFMALVEGRMSVSDGILTERLHLAGEAGALIHLLEALHA
jgi:hypothetical protein